MFVLSTTLLVTERLTVTCAAHTIMIHDIFDWATSESLGDEQKVRSPMVDPFTANLFII